MKNKISIIVNSTDSFEDCWLPFFTLLKAYWPDCSHPLYLNTETKQYQHKGMNIVSTQVANNWEKSTQIPWSNCLINCLNLIESDYVLYLQDDYFINSTVDNKVIEELVELMEQKDIAHINLMYLDKSGVDLDPSFHPLLNKIKRKANYRISLQAGLWNKKTLLSYLVPDETGWQFERKGSQRAHRQNDIFLCQNKMANNNSYIVPYKATGIIKGQWLEKAVVDLFAKHSIEVDYSIRGFFKPNKLKGLLIPFRAKLRRLYMFASTWLPTNNK